MKSGIFLFNNKQELISTISPDSLIENTQEIELNGLITATVTTKYSKDIEISEYFGVKELNNFWLYKIRKFSKEGEMITLNGIHILFDDLKGQVLRDIRPTKVTALESFTKILENSTWKVGVSQATTTSSANFYYKSVLESFYEALKKWNCEFIPQIEFKDGKIISKKINLYDKISKDNGKWFEYGNELLTVVAETDKDIYTAFIGLGKGEETKGGGFGRKIKFDSIIWESSKGKPTDKPFGQDFVEIKEASKLWGYPDGTPRIGIVEFSDIEDKEELLKKTYLYAKENCRPKLQLKSTVISQEQVEIGETCTIIRNDLDIRYKTRIFKIKKNFLNTDLISFEFGDKVVLSASDRIKSNLEKEEKKEIELESKMEIFLKNATNFYFNDDGYNYELKANNEYNLPAGYYSFNKPIEENPTKVLYVGAGKILIADSKNPNGEWKWRTAITPQGIAGEEIVTNSITANKLSADVGQSLDLSSNESINNVVNKSITNEVEKIRIGGNNLAKHSDNFYNSVEEGGENYWSAAADITKKKITDCIDVSYCENCEDWIGYEIVEFSNFNWAKIESEQTDNLFSYDFKKHIEYMYNSELKTNQDYMISFDVVNPNTFNLVFKKYISKTDSYFTVILKPKEYIRIYFKLNSDDTILPFDLEEGAERPEKIKIACKKLKVEEGTVGTAWSPNIDDLEEVDKVLKNAIDFLISDNKDLLKKYDGLNLENVSIRQQLSTDLKQTRDEFLFQFNNYKQLLDETGQVMEQRFNDISKYIRFKNGKIELGDINSPFKTLITHEKISFLKGESEVAYISNNKLYITNAYIINSLRIGNFEFIVESNGGLSFRKAVN